jgi:hypothetical protein
MAGEVEHISVAEYLKLAGKRTNKYNARRKEYRGILYDSIKEANYAQYLDLLKAAGKIKRWTRQYRIPFIVNNQHIGNYRIDFRIVVNDIVTEWHEVKGKDTQLWRFKWRLFCALYPGYIKKIIR